MSGFDRPYCTKPKSSRSAPSGTWEPEESSLGTLCSPTIARTFLGRVSCNPYHVLVPLLSYFWFHQMQDMTVITLIMGSWMWFWVLWAWLFITFSVSNLFFCMWAHHKKGLFSFSQLKDKVVLKKNPKAKLTIIRGQDTFCFIQLKVWVIFHHNSSRSEPSLNWQN